MFCISFVMIRTTTVSTFVIQNRSKNRFKLLLDPFGGSIQNSQLPFIQGSLMHQWLIMNENTDLSFCGLYRAWQRDD
jgi:hypothetical protein